MRFRLRTLLIAFLFVPPLVYLAWRMGLFTYEDPRPETHHDRLESYIRYQRREQKRHPERTQEFEAKIESLIAELERERKRNPPSR